MHNAKLKAQTQYVAGILLEQGKNNIVTDEIKTQFEKDKWAQELVKAGLLEIEDYKEQKTEVRAIGRRGRNIAVEG